MINQIICGDCLEVMKDIPEELYGRIVVITDPPYGLGIDGQKLSITKNPKHSRKEHKFMGWDSNIPPREYFEEMFRISKNQIIWGGNYFVEYFTEGHKGWIVWDKGQHGLTMSDCELAYSSFDCPTRVKVMNRVEILKDGSMHPTQKPLALMKWVIDKYTTPDSIIVDTFCGSGTTLVGAKELGREYIGIDIGENWCEIARKRLAQGELF